MTKAAAGGTLWAICPACDDRFDVMSAARGDACASCGRNRAGPLGLCDLRTDQTQDTLLNVATYDGTHRQAEKGGGLARLYIDDDAQDLDVLEIGAGSGNLTRSLLAKGSVRRLVATDISADFLARLAASVDDGNRTRLALALVDANALPFPDAQFDAVVGHSVLHHIARFEKTLSDSLRLLRPGGRAVFGEPVLDYHAICALAAAMILGSARMAGEEVSRGVELALTKLAKRPAIKRKNFDGDRNGLGDIEDKFQFAIEDMKKIGREIGFADVRFVSRPGPRTFGDAARFRIEKTFGNANADPAFLDRYDWVFEAVTETYARPLGLAHAMTFGFFEFLTDG